MYNNRRGGGAGLIVALIMGAFALFRYFSSSTVNTVTGEKQHIAGISAQQEVALGLQSAPELAQQFGGLSQDARGQQLVDEVGSRVVAQSSASKGPYKYQFHLLEDQKTVNAFALPGGQVFITEALLHRLKTEGQLAGVLGHEVGHVVGRHGAEHIAKEQLTQGLTGAAVLATYDPSNPNSRGSAAVIAAVGQLVNMKFGRNDELESDKMGVTFMSEAGYDPRSMITVMQILKEAAGGKGGGKAEFFSTHPNPDNRIQRIEQAIKATFPQGIPQGLEK